MSACVIPFPVVARRPIPNLHLQEVPSWVGHGNPVNGCVIVVLPVVRVARYEYGDDGDLWEQVP